MFETAEGSIGIWSLGEEVRELLGEQHRKFNLIKLGWVFNFAAGSVSHEQFIMDSRAISFNVDVLDANVVEGEGVGERVKEGGGILSSDTEASAGGFVVDIDVDREESGASIHANGSEMRSDELVDALAGAIEGVGVATFDHANDVKEAGTQVGHPRGQWTGIAKGAGEAINNAAASEKWIRWSRSVGRISDGPHRGVGKDISGMNFEIHAGEDTSDKRELVRVVKSEDSDIKHVAFRGRGDDDVDGTFRGEAGEAAEVLDDFLW